MSPDISGFITENRSSGNEACNFRSASLKAFVRLFCHLDILFCTQGFKTPVSVCRTNACDFYFPLPRPFSAPLKKCVSESFLWVWVTIRFLFVGRSFGNYKSSASVDMPKYGVPTTS